MTFTKKENVPVRDMRTISESLMTCKNRDIESLLSSARIALARVIIHQLVEGSNDVPVISLDPALEQIIHKSVQQARQVAGSDTDEMILEPGMAEKLHTSLAEVVQRQETTGGASILLVSPMIRSALHRFTRGALPSLSVLSYPEIPEDKKITIIASIGDI